MLPTIIIDTREQKPYSFNPQLAESIRQALPAGDYSLIGFEDVVSVERKSLDDLVGTIIQNRERFIRELIKLQPYEYACVVVEGTLKQIMAGTYRSEAHPNSVLGTMVAMTVDYKIPFYLCHNRDHAQAYTERYLLRVYKKMQRDNRVNE